MVTKVIFLPKSIDPFQKWTKKMSKIEKTKKLLDNFLIYYLINNLINYVKYLKNLI
jgi:hypothetical protein